MDRYQIEIDGSTTASNGEKYIEYVKNWNNLFPRIQRDAKYHGFLASYSIESLIFTKAAKDYLKTRVESYGAFASSTFKIKKWNTSENGYDDVVDGTLDYLTYQEDVLGEMVLMRFFPQNDAENLVNRAAVPTSLQSLKDFDGDAITAFAGTHGETYTLPVTKTEIGLSSPEPTSNCEVMLAWEVALRLSQKIIGRNDCLRSNLLGRTDAEVVQTVSDGDLAYLAFTNGGLLRGGSVSDYPIRWSLDEFFEVLNAFQPIGMGVEYINNEPFIRIEAIDYWYESGELPSLNTSAVSDVVVEKNRSRIYGKVLTGFRVFEKAAQEAGSDTYNESVHTRRSYVTGLDGKTKNEYNIRVNVLASPQVIETVRNNTVAGGQNDEMDRQNIVIQVKDDGASGWEVDNDYVSVTGINNPTTQKNYLITPGRTVLNHLKMINGCLITEYKRQEALGGFTGFDPIQYQEGDGNTSAATRIGAEAAEISENADLTAGVEPIFLDDDIQALITMTESEFTTVQDNLKKKITVNYDGNSFTGYVQAIESEDLNNFRLILKKSNEDYTAP